MIVSFATSVMECKGRASRAAKTASRSAAVEVGLSSTKLLEDREDSRDVPSQLFFSGSSWQLQPINIENTIPIKTKRRIFSPFLTVTPATVELYTYLFPGIEEWLWRTARTTNSILILDDWGGMLYVLYSNLNCC